MDKNTKNLKVSVIIPVYNSAKTLWQCLESVLGQNYDNYEVIVVDNNSTDDSKKIIKDLQKKTNKIKYVFEEKIGRGLAKNTGVTKAIGEIIVMTDADCVVPKNWIAELIKPILCENENIVMGSEKDIINNYWTKNYQKANDFNRNKLKENHYIKNLDTKNFAIKSSLLKKMMFDQNLNALVDFELYLRLKNEYKIRFLPEVMVNHYHRDSFSSYFKMQFERGYWASKIYKKHRYDKSIKKELLLRSISVKNFLLFPFWVFLQFLKKPPKEAFFVLISEIAWRAGLIKGIFN